MHGGKGQPLFHVPDLDPEPGRNVLGRLPLVNKGLERFELVRRMHGFPLEVLGQTLFLACRRIIHLARKFRAIGDFGMLARLRQIGQGDEPALAADHFEMARLAVRLHDEVLQQPHAGDTGFQARRCRLDLTDVGRGQVQVFEGDHLNGHVFSPLASQGTTPRTFFHVVQRAGEARCAGLQAAKVPAPRAAKGRSGGSQANTGAQRMERAGLAGGLGGRRRGRDKLDWKKSAVGA